MKRRNFLSLAGGAAAAGTLGTDRTVVASQPQPTSSQQGRRPVRMYVGTQQGPTTSEMLEYFKRHGVDHICGYPPDPGPSGYWTVEQLKRTHELCEKHGVTLDMVALPFLSSSHIDREPKGAIMLGQSPERDRDIDAINVMIAHCARRASRPSSTT